VTRLVCRKFVALYLGKIVSYAQGFSQLRAASDEYNWDLNYGEIAKIFRAGCIIRAQFLQKITDAYEQNTGQPASGAILQTDC
jgi:6-phosphogluconate dehydrogenase